MNYSLSVIARLICANLSEDLKLALLTITRRRVENSLCRESSELRHTVFITFQCYYPAKALASIVYQALSATGVESNVPTLTAHVSGRVFDSSFRDTEQLDYIFGYRSSSFFQHLIHSTRYSSQNIASVTHTSKSHNQNELNHGFE